MGRPLVRRSTATRPSSSAACCRSSGPSSRCRPASRGCRSGASRVLTLLGCIPWMVGLTLRRQGRGGQLGRAQGQAALLRLRGRRASSSASSGCSCAGAAAARRPRPMPPPADALPLRHALALGLLHGPAELLPVSSSGHTTLVPWLLGWPYPELDPELRKAFEVGLHAGTAVGAADRAARARCARRPRGLDAPAASRCSPARSLPPAARRPGVRAPDRAAPRARRRRSPPGCCSGGARDGASPTPAAPRPRARDDAGTGRRARARAGAGLRRSMPGRLARRDDARGDARARLRPRRRERALAPRRAAGDRGRDACSRACAWRSAALPPGFAGRLARRRGGVVRCRRSPPRGSCPVERVGPLAPYAAYRAGAGRRAPVRAAAARRSRGAERRSAMPAPGVDAARGTVSAWHEERRRGLRDRRRAGARRARRALRGCGRRHDDPAGRGRHDGGVERDDHLRVARRTRPKLLAVGRAGAPRRRSPGRARSPPTRCASRTSRRRQHAGATATRQLRSGRYAYYCGPRRSERRACGRGLRRRPARGAQGHPRRRRARRDVTLDASATDLVELRRRDARPTRSTPRATARSCPPATRRRSGDLPGGRELRRARARDRQRRPRRRGGLRRRRRPAGTTPPPGSTRSACGDPGNAAASRRRTSRAGGAIAARRASSPTSPRCRVRPLRQSPARRADQRPRQRGRRRAQRARARQRAHGQAPQLGREAGDADLRPLPRGRRWSRSW